jgi:hypothetical protein
MYTAWFGLGSAVYCFTWALWINKHALPSKKRFVKLAAASALRISACTRRHSSLRAYWIFYSLCPNFISHDRVYIYTFSCALYPCKLQTCHLHNSYIQYVEKECCKEPKYVTRQLKPVHGIHVMLAKHQTKSSHAIIYVHVYAAWYFLSFVICETFQT